MDNYGLGLFKSPPDGRDFLYKSFVLPVKLPSFFSIQSKMSPVVSQGQEGSCAGQTAKGTKEYQERMDTGRSVELSARYVYEYAKKISGHTEGTTLKAILEILLKCGICEEKLWPYLANNSGKPLPGADENATNYKIKGYARITTIEELKQALFNPYPNGGAILAGLALYKGAVGKQAKETGITPDPGFFEYLRGPIGGHALEACEWNDNSPYYKKDGHIKFKGSWSMDFGDKGYHYFSYRNLKSSMLDCFAIVDIEGSRNILTVASLPDERGLWL